MGSFVHHYFTRLLRRFFFIALIALPLATQQVHADTALLRIGTGGSAGTYFPIGSIIAESFTGSNKYHSDAVYNEPELLVVPQRASGSGSNVVDLNEGLLEGALTQANVAHSAYNGIGPFDRETPKKQLRGLASLYLETAHLVVRTAAGINSIEELEGMRVSLDEQGSGTLIDSLVILEEFGIERKSIDTVFLGITEAIERMRDNQLDALFVIAGYPIEQLSRIMDEGLAKLLPISGTKVDEFIESNPFLIKGIIPPGAYNNSEEISTLGVPAQLIVGANLSNELVYNLTTMLWSEETLDLLRSKHPIGEEIRIDSALNGMEIPLHPGAEKFYQEQGMLERE